MHLLAKKQLPVGLKVIGRMRDNSIASWTRYQSTHGSMKPRPPRSTLQLCRRLSVLSGVVHASIARGIIMLYNVIYILIYNRHLSWYCNCILHKKEAGI